MLDQISSIAQDATVDKLFIQNRLDEFVKYFGNDDPMVQQILSGRTTEELAQHVISTSIFSQPDALVDTLLAVDSLNEDPALGIIAAISERLQNFQSGFAGLGAQETELNAEHGRARFDVYGTTRPPDATFSLRIADGYVAPYEYNGTESPTFTTFFGLFDRHYSHKESGEGGEWALPDRWLNAPATFDRSVQMNLVSTNDIIGGNSGSPLLNKDLEVVGLIFDGNIESLPSAFIYQTERARTVSVDVRGMREALDEIYDADRLVLELDEGILVETEAEADARSN
jgi:hypothetical protein